MDSVGASLEAEQRSKAEALRIKKKLEGEINELEIGLDSANKANSEGLKAIKRYQGQLRETIQAFEDAARARQQVTEQVGIADRKAAALSGEMEESRALLDSAERANRQLVGDIADARNAVSEMQSINSRDQTTKRSLEGTIHTIQAEIDAMLQAAKNAEEKSKKAMMDAARLADELRAEQDHTNSQVSAKKSLESQLSDIQGRLADAETAAMKGGKAAMSKLEMRIRELEAELGSTQSRTAECMKGYQRAERKVKELQFSQGEDKKNQDRMSELAGKLQQKIKTYKQQIEEAEEIAALNLAKFRKAQQDLEETQDRANMAESNMSAVRLVVIIHIFYSTYYNISIFSNPTTDFTKRLKNTTFCLSHSLRPCPSLPCLVVLGNKYQEVTPWHRLLLKMALYLCYNATPIINCLIC